MPVAFQITVDVNPAAARAVALDAAEQLVTDVTRRVFNRAIVLTPVRTGNLRAQNNMRVQRTVKGALGEVFNDSEYAAAVHNGNKAYTVRPKPHMITVKPKNGTRLRFVVGGNVVYARSVRMQKPLRFVVGGKVVFAQSARIPARRGRPWLTRALMEVAGPAGFTLSTNP